jgi:hypothetical protein
MAKQLEALGWRRCAVGQRTTQHCGLVEEARAQERARIVTLIREHIALWAEGQWIGIPVDDDDDFDEVIALKRLLSDVEDTGHE